MVNKKLEICERCKKNEATLTFANSLLDWTHGHSERICKECYDNQIEGSPAYKRGYKAAKQRFLEDDIKWLQSVLDTKHIAEESRWIIVGRISKLNEMKIVKEDE